MFDLIAGQAPFHQEEVDSILWRIGSGQTTSLQDINCTSRLKVRLVHVLIIIINITTHTSYGTLRPN